MQFLCLPWSGGLEIKKNKRLVLVFCFGFSLFDFCQFLRIIVPYDNENNNENNNEKTNYTECRTKSFMKINK